VGHCLKCGKELTQSRGIARVGRQQILEIDPLAILEPSSHFVDQMTKA
jgi:hypothetical protein